MVRHRRRIHIEALEARSLLSSISYDLTTDQSTYQVGQTIHFTFTETNTSSQPVTVEVAPTDFTVSQGNGVIWQSNPGNANQPSTAETLQPGQSVMQTASWDGTTPDPYSNPLFVSKDTPLNNWGSFVVTNPNAPTLTAAFQITDPISTSLTTDRSVYQVGQPVQLTFTQTNTSNQSITFLPSLVDAFSIEHDGTVVMPGSWKDTISPQPATWAPGQSATTTQTWNGIPQGVTIPAGGLTGTFVVGYGPNADPLEYSTTFQVIPSSSSLVTTITTDHTSYQSGQPVNLTFTETDDGSQPVTIVTGPADFQVSQDGSVFWSSGVPESALTLTTLQPGQSVKQTATWNGDSSNGRSIGVGTFVVTDRLDPNGKTATFQISPWSPTQDPTAPQSPTSTPTPTSTGVSSGPTSPTPTTAPIVATLSTNRPDYRAGERVRITLTIKDTGTNAKVAGNDSGTATPDPKLDRITVLDGSKVVWRSRPGVFTRKGRHVQPGQTLTFSAVWNGRPGRGGLAQLAPGTYAIEASGDAFPASTTITIMPGRAKV